MGTHPTGGPKDGHRAAAKGSPDILQKFNHPYLRPIGRLDQDRPGTQGTFYCTLIC